ncbi:hypothetical protein OHS18_15645 [Amycolatopsis sp. NBC_00355]|uniref:hypothetical protein n=1 Tax=Amycolatopsis sp. NBC_00355 TaxID=2975957 RepID=UPI002E25DC5B
MKIRTRIATAVAVIGVAAATALGGAVTASAETHPEDAPPGYAGPFPTCNGTFLERITLPQTAGYVDVWYSSAGSGTFCAKTFDNLPGRHHIEVVLQHAGWTTRWYDSDDNYDSYAGGIYVSDANTLCAQVYGEVTVNAVPHASGWNTICKPPTP